MAIPVGGVRCGLRNFDHPTSSTRLEAIMRCVFGIDGTSLLVAGPAPAPPMTMALFTRTATLRTFAAALSPDWDVRPSCRCVAVVPSPTVEIGERGSVSTDVEYGFSVVTG